MANAAQNGEMTIKILLVGDSSVGKTCILLRYSENKFQEAFLSTIGLDFKVKRMVIDEKPIKLQVWDTAGQEQYRTITKSFLRGADGILLVFDLTNQTSFDMVNEWMNSIKENASSTVDIFLVGNKCDLEKVVTEDMINEFKRTNNVPYFETSARSGLGIQETFLEMAKVIKKRKENEPEQPPANTIDISQPKKNRKKRGLCK
ncbi:Rab GTPase [Histomonas meleagridis]|uniref:Rab GTPase n=1 Tax=Histomonas meleagridis TaxID=135588 RepID=UPI00355A3EEC|nr:Rab GTPase [Histomonas meleagridis]KAH0800691.1 Rab GTPase [Histomonas meleagridis]